MALTRRRLLFVVTTSLLCLLVPMQQASSVNAQGTIIWSAHHEELGEVEWYRANDAGWGGAQFNTGCAGVAPQYGFGRNPSGSTPGPVSLLFTMAAPCGELQVSGARLFRFREPEQYPDLYYRVWYYFPQNFRLTDPSNPWWIIMAWKSSSTMPARDDPFFTIGIANRSNENMFVYLYESKPYDPSNARSYRQTLVDLPVGQWFYIEGHYKSRGDATGQVTIWQGDEVNRTLLWDLQDVQTRYPDAEGGRTAWAVTSYGNGTSPSPAQFMIDDAEIRTP